MTTEPRHAPRLIELDPVSMKIPRSTRTLIKKLATEFDEQLWEVVARLVLDEFVIKDSIDQARRGGKLQKWVKTIVETDLPKDEGK